MNSSIASAHFKVLPDPILYPNYYAIITRPVCLADMNALINGADKYTLVDMIRDVRRMIGNAKRYNVPDSQVYQDALLLEVRGLGEGAVGVPHRASSRCGAGWAVIYVATHTTDAIQ